MCRTVNTVCCIPDDSLTLLVVCVFFHTCTQNNMYNNNNFLNNKGCKYCWTYFLSYFSGKRLLCLCFYGRFFNNLNTIFLLFQSIFDHKQRIKNQPIIRVEMYTFSRNKISSNPSIWSKLSLLTIFFISSCVAYLYAIVFAVVMSVTNKYNLLGEAVSYLFVILIFN